METSPSEAATDFYEDSAATVHTPDPRFTNPRGTGRGGGAGGGRGGGAGGGRGGGAGGGKFTTPSARSSAISASVMEGLGLLDTVLEMASNGKAVLTVTATAGQSYEILVKGLGLFHKNLVNGMQVLPAYLVLSSGTNLTGKKSTLATNLAPLVSDLVNKWAIASEVDEEEKEALRVMARGFVKKSDGIIPQKHFSYLLWCVEVLRMMNKIEANLPSDKPAPSTEARVSAPAGGGSGAAGPGTDPTVFAQLAALHAKLAEQEAKVAKQEAEMAKQSDELAATRARVGVAENTAITAMTTAGEARSLSQTAVNTSREAMNTSRAALVTAATTAVLAIEAPDDLSPEQMAMYEAAKATAKSRFPRMIKSGAVARIVTGRPAGALADAASTVERKDE